MNTIPLFVIIPLSAAFLTALLSIKSRRAGEWIAVAGPLALLVLALGLVPVALRKGLVTVPMGNWMPPKGIAAVADGLTVFMLVTVNLVSFLVMVYATRYMRRYTDTGKFYSLYMLMLAGMNGVIISGDLFNLYVFLEIGSVAGYALVAFGIEPEDLEASFRYTVMGTLASIFILLGIALLYGYTSTLQITDIAGVLAARPRGALVGLVSVLFLAGFGVKSALVPFHSWLPDAHSSAPAPVSATLSGVFIKTIGIYACARLFFTMLGPSARINGVLIALGILSMCVGALLACAQDDIKRMCAYSSISQIGYIFCAFGIGTPLAVMAGLFHLFNHAIFKSLLFLNAGAIEYAAHTRSLRRMGGLNAALPTAGFTSLIGSLSIAGVPPFGGFWSKLLIIIAALQAGHTGVGVVAVLVSILTLAYYVRFQTHAFFGSRNVAAGEIAKVPFAMNFSMIALAVISCAAGLLLTPAAKPLLQSAAAALGGTLR